jgi:acylphosphatase
MARNNAMKTRAHLIVGGRVQGVCFRMYTVERARELGVTGWVRNRDDGTVEAVAEGEEDQVAEFESWCRHGPPYAHVTCFQSDRSAATGEFDDFRILH